MQDSLAPDNSMTNNTPVTKPNKISVKACSSTVSSVTSTYLVRFAQPNSTCRSVGTTWLRYHVYGERERFDHGSTSGVAKLDHFLMD